MARPKLELTAEMLEQREKSKERIEAYFKYLKGLPKPVTRQAVADSWGIALRSIGNYTSGRSYISREMANLFEEKTGILAAYWAGLTDCRTQAELEEEWKHIIFDESDVDALNAPNTEPDEQRQNDKENTAFFARFGFKYENLDPLYAPTWMALIGIDDPDYSPEKEYKTYRLSSVSSPDLSACFTKTELQQIFDRLHDTLHSMIELECYRKASQDK